MKTAGGFRGASRPPSKPDRSMSSSIQDNVCYICLEAETKQNKFHNTRCGCTGSVNIHKHCYDDLIFSRGTAECCVCKRDMIEYCIDSGMQVIYKAVDDLHIAKYTISTDGKKQGVYYEYHKNTRDIRIMMEFSNGLPHGETSLWRPDGSVHLQGNFVRGMRHGQWMEFEADCFMGYALLVYFQDSLIEYYKYNYQQEQIDYEYYGDPHMNRLAAELSSELFKDITIPC